MTSPELVTADDLVALLPRWLPGQRWFGGKTQEIAGVRLLEATTLRAAPRVEHLVVAVEAADGTTVVYQVPLSVHAWRQDKLDHVLVGEVGGSPVYDALHDRAATEVLLDLIATDTTIGAVGGRHLAGADLPLGELSLVHTGEQSNTSLMYGDKAILKVFRRLTPGLNPDIEVHEALTRVGCPYVAPLLGWLHGSWHDPNLPDDPGAVSDGSLGMIQAYLASASDGWRLATASVLDLLAEGDLHADEVGGDFAAEAYRLGFATAETHQALVETLETAVWGPGDLGALATGMRARLAAASAEVPALAPLAPALDARYDALAHAADRADAPPVTVQRVHGDYHLGQVMRTIEGWRLLDFEGEPEKPMAARLALEPPVRDVAGMLRSFDYAARSLLVSEAAGGPVEPTGQDAYRAAEWAARNRDAFCDGYAKAGQDLRDQPVLLAAYELDKAVYEVVYEARNRPSWVQIPMAALTRLAGSTG